jgi:hypothetical protein
MENDSVYETDEHLWLEETIALLRSNRLEDLDIEHLIEELESLSKRDKNRVSSLLEQILRHLLLLQYWTIERERNRNHWRSEIQSFRTQLQKALTTSLQNHLESEFDAIYRDALEYVREKTGYAVAFPEICPYTLDRSLDKRWFPEEL